MEHRLRNHIIVIIVLLLICALLCIPGIIDVYKHCYKINNLELEQDELTLVATWDEAKAEGYEVFIKKDGKTVRKETVKEPRFEYDLKQVEKKYDVTVQTTHPIGEIGKTTRSISTKKADQYIYLNHYLFEGFEGKKFDVSGRAKTDITFTSENKKVAEITPEGQIKMKKAGNIKIKAKAAESDLYKASEETAILKVYPTKLKVPEMKVKKNRKLNSIVKWEAVPYADKYIIHKYNPWNHEYEKYKVVKKSDPLEVKVLRSDDIYTIKATAKILGKNIKSNESKPFEIKSGSHTAKTYNSLHMLGTLDRDDFETIAAVEGPKGMTCPQSFSYTGNGYLLAFSDKSGKKNALVEYSGSGEKLRTKKVKMGHANGSTYSPDTKLVYTLKRHKQIKSKICKTFNFDDFSESGSFKLPEMASGMCYDVSNGKFYLTGGSKVFITDENFHLERTIQKVVRRSHTQDNGAGNGIVIGCSWNSGSDSYIDLYRAEDGGYLGTYSVPLGEIESATMVDKHLIVLMNNSNDGSGDLILKTKKKIPIL